MSRRRSTWQRPRRPFPHIRVSAFLALLLTLMNVVSGAMGFNGISFLALLCALWMLWGIWAHIDHDVQESRTDWEAARAALAREAVR